MKTYIGIKDGEAAAIMAEGLTDDVWLKLGAALGIHVTDPGNVDLDEIFVLPCLAPGLAVLMDEVE